MSDTYSTGWNLLDVAASPVYGLLDTASRIPGINQTQFGNWLNDSPLFRGAQNFRDQEPGWALAADIGASFVPYLGWGSALNRAGQGASLLGRVNQAGAAAARLAPRSTPLAFALGETVRYAPPAAAITGFDLAGGRYESPMDALAGFGLGSVAGAGLQAFGHAVTPLVRRAIPQIGPAWSAVFEPTPELSALYGFSPNVQRAGIMAANPNVQEALSPVLEPQMRAAALWDLIDETNNGLHPEIDADVLRGQYDQEIRAILNQELDPAESGFRFPTGTSESGESRRAVDQLLRLAPNGSGNRVRVPLTGQGNQIENPDVLGAQLELPAGWVHETSLPGLTQTTLAAADNFRAQIGLEPTIAPRNGWMRLERITGMGRQNWAVRREAEDGSYLMVTEVPVRGSDFHRMTGRARYNSTRGMDKAEAARVFFSFKTHNPQRFFPSARAAFDSPDPGLVGAFPDRVPRGKSDFLDKAMDFNKIYLNKETLKAAYAAKYGSKQQREQFLRTILKGPQAGQTMAKLVETYAMPTQFQLRDSPEGRGILSLYQALFDAAEGNARALLHGTASIPEGKSPITSLFGKETVDDSQALAANLRRTLQEDPDALDMIRVAAYADNFPIESVLGTPGGKWLAEALAVNLREINEINAGIEALRSVGASDARIIPIRKGHIGLSRKWDGSTYVPIYAEGALEPTAVIAGHGNTQAKTKSEDWIAKASAKDGKKYRAGAPFITGETQDVPKWMKSAAMSPGLLEPRQGMRGYEYEFEPFKHVDDLVKELEEGYVTRRRYFASVIGDALTTGKLNQLRGVDPKSYNIVDTRIRQLKGQPGPLETRMNQIVDSALGPTLGTNSFSKTSEAFNEFNFHMLHGVGNIATPALNLTSVLQTQLPAATNFLTADINTLKGMGFQFPRFGEDGLPRPGFNYVTDPMGLLWGGFKNAMSSDPEVQEVFNVLFNRKIMGTGLANEYTGQDRTLAARWSEGIRGPEDIGYWLKRGSSILMSKTEQISRTIAAGMALKSMQMMEAATGVKFTMDQKIANAARFVEQTNFGYFTADRPQMYTTPLGAVFGNQKTWMTNYLFMMAEYAGLAQRGNMAPLLMTLGTTTALGGIFAVPLAGQAIDAITETFANQDSTEFIYERLGEGGNGISFGLPGLLGMSISGNVSAPGSNLAHDSEFFFTLVALERAKLMGRAIGRAWDDQVTLGLNPLKDELFQQQMIQAFAPRSLYRTWEAISSDSLRSAATGYPMIRELGWGARVMHGLGFRDTDIAIQYAAYERLVSDRDAMRTKVSQFGEAYAMASLNNDRARMMQLLQQAAVSGVDITSVMRSAQIRMRNYGHDMFGRNFNEQQLERYQETLRTGGM